MSSNHAALGRTKIGRVRGRGRKREEERGREREMDRDWEGGGERESGQYYHGSWRAMIVGGAGFGSLQ